MPAADFWENLLPYPIPYPIETMTYLGRNIEAPHYAGFIRHAREGSYLGVSYEGEYEEQRVVGVDRLTRGFSWPRPREIHEDGVWYRAYEALI
jgi:hypothetical protein